MATPYIEYLNRYSPIIAALLKVILFAVFATSSVILTMQVPGLGTCNYNDFAKTLSPSPTTIDCYSPE